ncbi:MAG: four-carbon acid sugar kinase family protein [Planctomycetia bacterium]|nr:four-carbon acid sugar kinase family protein [Planctomycetia bacterium]
MPAPVPTSKIIVLADDLSGAAELAGIAFAHGLPAEVQRQFEPATGAQLIAIDTDSRHLSAAAAADLVRSITAQVLTTEPAWIFKKVDSVLRGNVRAEIEAILETTGQSRALLIPANPSRGRVIRGGHYFIDGIPLGETHFAQDPEHPRRSSDVLALLGPKSVGAADVMVPDVETQSQLEELAAQRLPTPFCQTHHSRSARLRQPGSLAVAPQAVRSSRNSNSGNSKRVWNRPQRLSEATHWNRRIRTCRFPLTSDSSRPPHKLSHRKLLTCSATCRRRGNRRRHCQRNGLAAFRNRRHCPCRRRRPSAAGN